MCHGLQSIRPPPIPRLWGNLSGRFTDRQRLLVRNRSHRYLSSRQCAARPATLKLDEVTVLVPLNLNKAPDCIVSFTAFIWLQSHAIFLGWLIQSCLVWPPHLLGFDRAHVDLTSGLTFLQRHAAVLTIDWAMDRRFHSSQLSGFFTVNLLILGSLIYRHRKRFHFEHNFHPIILALAAMPT